jgi:hypothetical protein
MNLFSEKGARCDFYSTINIAPMHVVTCDHNHGIFFGIISAFYEWEFTSKLRPKQFDEAEFLFVVYDMNGH